MAFKMNTKAPNKKVKWKFETLDQEFISDLERFKRNVSYWKSKLQVSDEVQVEILEGGQHLYQFLEEEKNIIDVEHTEVTEEPQLESRLEENEHIIPTDAAIESRVDESDAQPDLFEDLESDVNTPKPKRRKKAI